MSDSHVGAAQQVLSGEPGQLQRLRKFRTAHPDVIREAGSSLE